METTQIISLVTFAVTLIMGQLSKKFKWFDTNYIPVQNIIIGLTVACVEWAVTKDFSAAIALSGILAGGSYDLASNLNKIKKSQDNK